MIPSNAIAARIYEEISPLAYADEENDWVLLRFIEAWTENMVEIDDLVRDSVNGPGWSTAMDVDTAPDKFLDFISQFVGIEFAGGESASDKRDIINALVNLRRGSPAASRAWIDRHLTGTKYVLFNERSFGSAYRYSVRTFASETPDPDIVERGLKEQKPAGLLMDYATIGGMTYDTIAVGYDTYTLSYVSRATYFEWGTELP